MRLVNTKAHALIDYGVGLVLLFSPWLFDFSSHGKAAMITRFLGGLMASLALITRFEFSILKLLPLKWHLRIDFVTGILLAGSPWLFGFCPEVFKPHVVFGLTQMVVAVITDRVLHQTYKKAVEKQESWEMNQPSEPKKRKNYF